MSDFQNQDDPTNQTSFQAQRCTRAHNLQTPSLQAQNLQAQKELRDTIGSMLELSRSSWKLQQDKKNEADAEEEASYPRSLLFKTLGTHPLLSVATLASIWFLGPARFSAVAVTGVGLLAKHHTAILPIAQQLIATNLFGRKENKATSNTPTDAADTTAGASSNPNNPSNPINNPSNDPNKQPT